MIEYKTLKVYGVRTRSHPEGAVVGKLVQAPDGTKILWREYPEDVAIYRLGDSLSYSLLAHEDAALEGATLVHHQSGSLLYEAYLDDIDRDGFIQEHSGEGQQIYYPVDAWRQRPVFYRTKYLQRVTYLVPRPSAVAWDPLTVSAAPPTAPESPQGGLGL